MLEGLSTEQQNSAARDLESLSPDQLLTAMNAADAEIPAAVATQIPRIAQAVDAISERLEHGGRLFYVGAGTSGRLALLDAVECPPTFGVPRDMIQAILAGGLAAISQAIEGVEDDADAGRRDLEAAGCRSQDAVVGVSASGRTPYVLGALRKAQEVGALTGGISCTPDSELSRAVAYPIEPVPGPEIVTGSTRLRAGTATKLVLNMLSTAVMVRLGYVYGNLMVNVQPTNRKLEDRARRIIRQAAGVSAERAAELLDASGRSVRIAIIMGIKQLTRAEAEKLLAAAKGRIRKALELA
jgi:N-acetylmuramic acid 6-phosphate etherase